MIDVDCRKKGYVIKIGIGTIGNLRFAAQYAST